MIFQTFDEQYVQQLTAGDPAVEEHFAAYFGGLLYLKLRARLRSPQLIDDIRQETLLRVLHILRNRGGVVYPERFGAFVNSVCNHVLMEMCRTEARLDPMDDQREEPPDPSIDLDAPLINTETRRDIQRVLKGLPEKDRTLLQAVYLDETDKSEVCRRHNVDADYLRVLLHRAKTRFRRAYLDRGGPPPPSLPA